MTPEEMAALPVGAIVEDFRFASFRWEKVSDAEWVEVLNPEHPTELSDHVYSNQGFIRWSIAYKVVTE